MKIKWSYLSVLMQVVRLTNVVVYYFYFIQCTFLEHAVTIYLHVFIRFRIFTNGLMRQDNMQGGWLGKKRGRSRELNSIFYVINGKKEQLSVLVLCLLFHVINV